MIAFLIVMTILVTCSYLNYRWEKHRWNDGVSRTTGYRWRFFAMDSSGARGYSDDHGNEIWISWNIEKR